MKKKVLFIAAIAAAVFTSNDVNAQDFKPAGGEKNIEVNFTPLGANPISINNLRFRYFMSSDMALRVGFSVSSSSTTTPDIYTVTTPNDVELEDKTSSFGFSLNPGIEMHFEGTDRLSPYYGAEILFSTVTNTTVDQSLTGVGTASFEQETTGGSSTFGVNLLLGADWYFTKSMYMGTEVGFGFASTNTKDDELTNATGPNTATATTVNGSSFNLGPNFNSAIRLGFLF